MKGVRWTPDPDGLGGTLLPRRASQIFYLVGMLWNLILPQVTRGSQTFTIVGVIAAIVFGYGFVRSLLGKTTIRFEHGRLTCVAGKLPPAKRFEHLISDIQGFAIALRAESWRIFLVTRSDARIELPIDLDGIVWTSSVSKKPLTGAATAEQAQFLADALFESLETARHSAVEYRIAGATPEIRVAPGDDQDDEAAVTRKRESR